MQNFDCIQVLKHSNTRNGSGAKKYRVSKRGPLPQNHCKTKHFVQKPYANGLQLLKKIMFGKVQWKPLNVITLRQLETDNNNRLITITSCFHALVYSKGVL